MELKLVYCLSDELRLRNSVAFSFSSVEDMKKKFYKKFKEQEKERGYGLNTFIRPVLKNFEILENDEIALAGEEVEFSFEMFLEESKKEKQSEDAGYSISNPFLEVMRWNDLEQIEQEESVRPAENISEETTMSEQQVSVKVDKIYLNLVDFIKDNPNCTVAEAGKFFSKKEIQKQIKLGKVYFRRGRLSV